MKGGEGELVRRIWDRDPGLWHDDPRHREEISRRLGWLEVAGSMRPACGDLVWMLRGLHDAGYRRSVLLGMGGSSLAPEVLRSVFPASANGLDLTVLDTTDATALHEATASLDLGRTLVIVASKSGTTIEVDAMRRHFEQETGGRGDAFVAITDPGTPLESLARAKGFRKVFLNPPDIGGRYSALSFFGLVPAALHGVDTGRLLDSALAMSAACRSLSRRDNPGLDLGLSMGEAALGGRDKVTLLLDRRLEPFGLWVEQLLAESTGKDDKGLVPVVGEPFGPPDNYGADRFVVAVTMGGSPDPTVLGQAAALERAGHPVVRIHLSGPLDLGAEFFRWEFATAVAGSRLKVNAFDQPDVQSAKTRTGELLAEVERGKSLPESSSGGSSEHLAPMLRSLRSGRDYVALLSYLPGSPALEAPLQRLRGRLQERFRVATTLGFGPRYLHSTGQLHKGGPNHGAFIMLTCEHPADLPVPGRPYSFSQLQRAQALGDLGALTARRRRVARLHLPEPSPAAVEAACQRVVGSV